MRDIPTPERAREKLKHCSGELKAAGGSNYTPREKIYRAYVFYEGYADFSLALRSSSLQPFPAAPRSTARGCLMTTQYYYHKTHVRSLPRRWKRPAVDARVKRDKEEPNAAAWREVQFRSTMKKVRGCTMLMRWLRSVVPTGVPLARYLNLGKLRRR